MQRIKEGEFEMNTFYFMRVCMVLVVMAVFSASMLTAYAVKHVYAICHHQRGER